MMNTPYSASNSQGTISTDNFPSSERLLRSHYHPRRQRNRSAPRSPRESVPAMESTRAATSSNIIWSDEGMSGWSDAITASTVLSLLHKEPLVAPPRQTSESEGHRRAQSRRSLICTVCFGKFGEESFPLSPIAAGCDHSGMPGVYICLGCLRQSLHLQVTSSNTCIVNCPLCHEQLSDDEVQRWASPETFQAYDRIRTWQILEEDAEFVPCIRPDCGYGQLHADGLEDPIVVCGSCGIRTCFIHRKTPWHEGLTCAEYEESLRPRRPNAPLRDGHRREVHQEVPRVPGLRRAWVNTSPEELLSMRMIADIAKPCPYCNAATERTGGCKQMKCMYTPIYSYLGQSCVGRHG